MICVVIFRPTFSMGEENHDLLFSDPHFQWGGIMICVAFFFFQILPKFHFVLFHFLLSLPTQPY